MAARRVGYGRGRLLICLIVVIMAGLGSRMLHSGLPLVDKYAGDALYAVMIYVIFSLFRKTSSPLSKAMAVMVFMTLLEVFQLSSIPLELTRSENVMAKFAGRLLGTTFSWLDLAAYFVGIAAVLFAELRCKHLTQIKQFRAKLAKNAK